MSAARAQLQRVAASRRKRIVLTLIGALLVGVGGVLVLVALWMVVAAAFSPLVATLVMAALALGGGALALALRPEPEPMPTLRDVVDGEIAAAGGAGRDGPPGEGTPGGVMAAALAAFAVGMRAGAAVAAAWRR